MCKRVEGMKGKVSPLQADNIQADSERAARGHGAKGV